MCLMSEYRIVHLKDYRIENFEENYDENEETNRRNLKEMNLKNKWKKENAKISIRELWNIGNNLCKWNTRMSEIEEKTIFKKVMSKWFSRTEERFYPTEST